MLIFALACTSPPASSPEPTPAPPPVVEPTPAPPAPPGEAIGLCSAEEKMRFSCSTKGGKIASLCEGKTGLVYRFGDRSSRELVVPETGYANFEISHRVTGEDAEVFVTSLWNDGHRYAVVSERTEDQFEGRVVVRKGAEPLSTVNCGLDLSADFTDVKGRFEGDAASVEAWIGEWTGGDAELTIQAKGNGLAVGGNAVWRGRNDVVHTGEVDGPLEKTATGWTYAQDECRLELVRTGPDQLEVKDNLKCGGLNVSFAGELTRTP